MQIFRTSFERATIFTIGSSSYIQRSIHICVKIKSSQCSAWWRVVAIDACECLLFTIHSHVHPSIKAIRIVRSKCYRMDRRRNRNTLVVIREGMSRLPPSKDFFIFIVQSVPKLSSRMHNWICCPVEYIHLWNVKGQWSVSLVRKEI